QGGGRLQALRVRVGATVAGDPGDVAGRHRRNAGATPAGSRIGTAGHPAARRRVRASPGRERRFPRARGRITAPTVSAAYFLPFGPSVVRAATKASSGTATRPTVFAPFLPSFCFPR